MSSQQLILWTAFNFFVLGMLALDLAVFHRKAHSVSLREAFAWSIAWICLALVFNLGIYHLWGQEKALEFLTGYLIEKSLSIDNLFVFLVVFSYFSVPATYQHRVLFWGIFGALIMRAIFIVAGAALLSAFHWMIYVFGGFLVFTGIKLLLAGDEKIDPEKNPVLRLVRRIMPVTKEYHGQRFLIRQDGKLSATPLLLVLVVIETTDVIFAVDSIPAIFAVTLDPFIVYTSNVFAILGLRALYFLLAGVMDMFRYLKVGLSFVLCFVGVKMVIVDIYKIPIGVSLGVIAGILACSMLPSLLPRLELGRLGALPLQAWSTKAFERDHRRRRMSMWGWLGIVAASLSLVKWASIPTGPSANEVIAAIRVAQQELNHAQSDPLRASRSELEGVEALLNVAWSTLEEKDYEQAILAARRAIELTRKSKN